MLSFQIDGMDCEAVGEALGARGIAVRAGLHCAPLAHQSAGTLEAGTVRASVSAFNTPREVERFTQEVARLTAGAKNSRVCGYFLCLHTGPVHRKLISLLLVNRL